MDRHFTSWAFVSVATGLALCLALSLAGRSARASTVYVSPAGNASGDGSAHSPWPSVTYALSRISGPGATIVLMPGIYRDPIVVDARDAGTAASPLIIKADTKWGATILGSPNYAIKTQTGADYVTFDGIECAGGLSVGIYLKGNHDTVRNCWVHNSGSVGIGAYALTGTLIENNLVEYNGQNPQFHHGIYAGGSELVVRNNIVRHNAALGIQLYPSISNSRIYNNLVYGHNKTGILVQCPKGGGHNVIANNTSVDNRPAIGIYNGGGEVLANNICKAASGDPIFVEGDVDADCNLCVPGSKYQGAHGLSADPQFVDAAHQCFWLKSTSPAVGAAEKRYAPEQNFWGLPVDRAGKPDIGAFAFEASLTGPSKRAAWHGGLPYRYRDQEGSPMPDLWKLPDTAPP